MANIDISQIVTAEMREAAIRAQLLRPLTRRQAKLGLLSIGITGAMIDARISAIEDLNEQEYARIEWEEASLIERDHPLVADLAQAFDLPPSQVDDLWLWAAQL